MSQLVGIGIMQLMRELQRICFNYELQFVDWVPWYKHCYDLRLLKVDRLENKVTRSTIYNMLDNSE